MGLTLIIVGIILFLSGVIVLIKETNTENVAKPTATKDNQEKYVNTAHSPSTTQITSTNQQINKNLDLLSGSRQQLEKSTAPITKNNDNKSPKEKGNDFEELIADIIRYNGLRIKQWNQGTVTKNGTIGENALNPDFFVEQSTDKKPIEYWIECKWRASLYADKFSLERYQYDRYRKIQRESKRKIILAIGIGNEPSDPKEMFFVPLDSISDGEISKDEMKHFFLSNPKAHLSKRMQNWFFNEVFKRK